MSVATCFQDLYPVLHLQGQRGHQPCRKGGVVLMPPTPTPREAPGVQLVGEPQAHRGQPLRTLKRAKSQARRLGKPLGQN